MDRKPKSEYAVGATELALVTTGAIVGGPAGAAIGVGASVLAKLGSAMNLWRDAKQSQFLSKVSFYLSEDSPEAAAAFINDHANRDEFVDTLERGYVALRRSFDPLAAECICLLTAEHARLGSPPDRTFARAAALLEESDEEDLTTLQEVVAAYVSTVGLGEIAGTRILFASRGTSKDRQDPFFFVAAYREAKPFAISDNVPSRPNLDRVLAHLSHHGFGTIWSGLGASPPPERSEGRPNSVHHFSSADDSRMTDLHTYLAPVRRRGVSVGTNT
jgi:hypothetical protein